MNYKLTVDDIRRVVDQYKDHDVTITTDGLGVYVARMANRQAIEVAKVLLAEIDRFQQERDEARRKAEEAWNENDAIERAYHKLIEGLREIDTHIRSTPEPVQYIVETLKRVLPEYQEGVTVE